MSIAGSHTRKGSPTLTQYHLVLLCSFYIHFECTGVPLGGAFFTLINPQVLGTILPVLWYTPLHVLKSQDKMSFISYNFNQLFIQMGYFNNGIW